MHAKYCLALLIAASLSIGAVRAAEDKATSQAEIEAQLKAAQQKLEEAAHEIAELSTQLGRPLVDRLMLMGEGPSRAVIGVQLDSKGGKDGAHVRDVSPGGPAAEAGIRPGDLIVSVNGSDVKAEHASTEVAHLVRNVEPNSKVKIRVLRDGKPLEFAVTARPLENPLDMPGMPCAAADARRTLWSRRLRQHARLIGRDAACDAHSGARLVFRDGQGRARAARVAQ